MIQMDSKLSPIKGFSFARTIEGRAILVSLVVGIIIVIVKTSAYLTSGSMAVMADMLESFVHNLAILFVAYCLWFSHLPADDNHLYGHGKSQFLSAAVEGAFVCGAALLIIMNCGKAYLVGYSLLNVSQGAGLAALAGVINAILGGWMIRTGKRQSAIILIAHGKHIMSDVVTTAAALVGMLVAWITNLIYIDLIVALLGGFYIFYEGLKLLRQSIAGLLDEANMEVDRKLRKILKNESIEHLVSYHQLRHRSEGNKHWMELHLVMDDNMALQEAHDLASHIESVIRSSIPEPITITSHLEPKSSLKKSGGKTELKSLE